MTKKSITLVIPKISKPKSEILEDSFWLLQYGKESVDHLLTAYRGAAGSKGRGAPTNVQQDLLRAALIMAGAALDTVVKQVIRDGIPHLIKSGHQKCRKQVGAIITRKLKMADSQEWNQILAEALLSDNPRIKLTDEVVQGLIGSSLQSESELQKTGNIMGIGNFLESSLKDAFNARNQIVHEFDIHDPKKLTQGKRARRPRKKDQIESWCGQLLDAAGRLIQAVDTEIETLHS